MKHRTFFHWVGVLALVAVAVWGLTSVVDAGGGRCGGSCGGHGKGHGEGVHGGKGCHCGPMGGHMQHLMKLAKHLDLNEEQIGAVHAIVEKNNDKIQAAIKAVMDKKWALHSAVLSGQSDEVAIRAAADELGDAIGDGAVFGSQIAAEVRSVLTPAQLEKLDTILAKPGGCSGKCGGGCLCGGHGSKTE